MPIQVQPALSANWILNPKPIFQVLVGSLLLSFKVAAAVLRMDVSSAPESSAWAQSAQVLAQEWYPRIGNLLLPAGVDQLPDVTVRLEPMFEGVAATAGTEIRMSSKRIMALPDDSKGALIHELVHVVQAYPSGQVGWVTEGIADYLRFAIYEAWPLSRFPRPEKAQGFRDSYQVAAGFLFWLECGPAPGIVRQLNASLQRGAYRESIFMDRTGRDLEQLWKDYLAVFNHVSPLPVETVAWRHAGGYFERQPTGGWVEFEHGKQTWLFEEIERTPVSITLLDKGRNIRLRITKNTVDLFRDDQWGNLYQGAWTNLSGSAKSR